jgi:AraC-like DNA-binding protein
MTTDNIDEDTMLAEVGLLPKGVVIDNIKRPNKRNRTRQPSSVRQVSMGEILKEFGRKNDPFYVIDSSEIRYRFSLLRPFKTNDFSVLYLDKGELTVRLGVSTYELKKSSLIIKSREQVFQVQHFSSDCHFRIFGFTDGIITSSGLAKKHLDAFSFLKTQNSPVLDLQAEGETSISQLFDVLHQKSRQKERSLYYEDAVHHAFALMAFEIASVFSRQRNSLPSAVGRKEHMTIEFLRLLPQYIRQERSVYFYASLLNVTPKYLSKCVKELTGKTCGELIDEAVILEAKVLLDDPELSVAQVADQLNFSDQFFFSKYFKKHTEVSPTAYRSTF